MELRDRVDAAMGRARADLAELVAMRSVADARQFPLSVARNVTCSPTPTVVRVGDASSGA